MKTFSFLAIFACILCFNKFEIIEATSQKWHGGIPGAGYGTYYELTIVPKANSDVLVFDEMWIGKEYYKISTFQKGKKMRNNLFAKGDTITIRVNARTNIKPMPFTEKDNCLVERHDAPKDYKGEAILSYKYKGKRKYKEIEKFKVKEELNYP